MPVTPTRRSVLAVAAAAGAGLLTGCSSADSGSSSPKKGGTLRAAFPGAGVKETMDPHAQRQFVDIARHKAVFDKLVELDSTLRPVPRLARSWSSDDDARVWRFELREARFHDGHVLDADDVLYSISRILDPDAADHLAKNSLSHIDLSNCRKVGRRGVEIALTRPNAELPSQLAMTGTPIVRDGWDDPKKPVGTGPFRFVSFTAGRGFTGRRFDDHWNGAPHLDEVRILSAETEARAAAVRSGEVHFAHEMTPTFARTVEHNSRVRVVATRRSGVQGFALKTDRAPFDDPDAAMAVKLLVDRERLVEVVCAGRAEIGNDVYGKGYTYYPEGLAQRERDVPEARRLLKRTGLYNKKVTFYTSTAADGFAQAAHLFTEQAGEAGLKVEVVNGPPESYFTDVLGKGTVTNHRCGAMTIPTYISERLLADAPQNATAWKHQDFDDAFTAARAMVDDDERSERYRSVQTTLRDQGGLVLWGHPEWLNAISHTVQGVKEAPPNTVDWARFDTVWLD
ncbi:ABC transporter substrate-binding protein [Streptomyces malaysiensis subsp. malaysiensis]|uniref:ABC transporter substrate-binding protein n=1 Tax=Streptomyces malaysiensis TaxID=92644 RepID=A0ABX6W2I8_STRMQ|nr:MULTISPECIES: ABC transporter substrate-binding protein [Streptomyces]MCD9586663.1 ABC transporter substrate-binding protein [Streptomyces sp. 8ZJF_21]QPI53786.1 ABC transporter substrate-binding protein [Streptomyces solisilvae]UHH15143.1 ABC transporter substrate-binding protein [Streptomyces sp. HNM0561]